jgi:carboxy-terminal domain RNA polymerase II polypeptide A small phosphatase
MKTLVLDLDETLIHSEFEYQMEGDFDFKIIFDNDDILFVKKRPGLDEFLEYAFDNFKIAIWTASTEKYAKSILEKCNVDISKLEFLWTREKCLIKTEYYGSYGLKNLSDTNLDLKEVLIVDDVEKTSSNNPENLILIKPYFYGKDNELLKLIKYLEKIKNEPDYRKLDKRCWSSEV